MERQYIHEYHDIAKVFIKMIEMMFPDMDLNFIRKDMSTDGGPTWEIDKDYIFYRFDNYELSWEKNRHHEYDDETKEYIVKFNNEKLLHLSVYGPNAFNITQEIKAQLFLPWIKQHLNKYYMTVSMHPSEPRDLTEQLGAQWWARSDIEIRIKHSVERRYPLAYIDGVDVELRPSNGNIYPIKTF